MPLTAVIGPAAVRSSGSGDDVPDWAATALATIDDEFALVDEHPVAVSALWRELFASLLIDGPALLICPSWWSERRVATVTDAARASVGEVAVQHRAEVSAVLGRHRCAVVVEIAGSFVAIIRLPGSAPNAFVAREGDAAVVADEVVRRVASMGGDSAVIDCADGRGGAADLAALVSERLNAVGIRIAVVDDDRLLHAAEHPEHTETCAESVDCGTTVAEPRTRRRIAVGIGLVATVLLAVVAVVLAPAPSGPSTTLLVEGHVVVEVPASWSAHRVTGGPGSVRFEVTSPTDPHVALHVTQSPVSSSETLRDTADTLRRAMTDEPPGVFVDFNPDDRRDGRAAVTYREIRAGHDISWAVLLDGGLRISIGCQSARGAEAAVAPACERAIASAREVAGTVAAQPQSNNT